MTKALVIDIKTFSQIVTLHSTLKSTIEASLIAPFQIMFTLLDYIRALLRLLLAALFLFAGIVHLREPGLFLPIMPSWVPFHLLCVLISGAFELLGGIGLLIPVRSIQVLTGWGLALLLIAVFPANVYMAMAHIRVHGFPSRAWMAWARLPLQPVLIIAALWATQAWRGKCK
jgi:uncharacterized membrane protein